MEVIIQFIIVLKCEVCSKHSPFVRIKVTTKSGNCWQSIISCVMDDKLRWWPPEISCASVLYGPICGSPANKAHDGKTITHMLLSNSSSSRLFTQTCIQIKLAHPGCTLTCTRQCWQVFVRPVSCLLSRLCARLGDSSVDQRDSSLAFDPACHICSPNIHYDRGALLKCHF